MPDEYGALLDKVSAFTDAADERRKSDLVCKAGCDACCQAWLTVSVVEAERVVAHLDALPSEAREQIRARGERELSREADGSKAPRCALLDDDGQCSIYDARPLVCRTQGHALLYPRDLLAKNTVRTQLPHGDVTHCPLNYQNALPENTDILDAGLVDKLLAVVSHRRAQAVGLSPLHRYALSALAAGSCVLASAELVHEENANRTTSDDDPRGR
jgi:hypothetical protein